MEKFHTFAFLLVISFCLHLPHTVTSAGEGSYCYEEPSCGPSSWGGACNVGQVQSPIDLEASSPEVGNLTLSFPRLITDQFSFKLTRFSMSLNLHLQDAEAVLLYSSSKRGYKLADIHFHWGSDDSEGSEHLVGGKANSMEMHLVHHSDVYTNAQEAINSGDPAALTVIGVLLQGVPEGTKEVNFALSSFISLLPKRSYNESVWEPVSASLDLTTLMPTSGDVLFMYQGSLTTPNCDEVVQWMVCEKPVYIAASDMQAIRSTILNEVTQIAPKTFRPTQPGNGRPVIRSTIAII